MCAARYDGTRPANAAFGANPAIRVPLRGPGTKGLCHQFAELDYDNNVAEVVLTIPDGRPGKVGYGAAAGQQLPKNLHEMVDDENRPSK